MPSFSLKNYHPVQREAIENATGPLLVLSGAGTGKTHLLTGKILSLILERGIPSEQILALTFTEKAMNEMRERVEQALPIGFGDLAIKTFHGLGETILRERGVEIGIPIDFRILSDADLWFFLKRHFLDFQFEYYRPLGNPQKFLSAIAQYWSRLQDEDISPDEYIKFAKQEDGPEKEKHRELAKGYKIYQQLLLENGYLDFGGLLFHTLRLFEKRPSVLAEYQARFPYIVVDEFQDTNFAQNRIVALLAVKHRNITVVGDDDQAIYKWRGASLTNIQFFEREFPERRVLVLRENYRSSQPILDAAYALIQKNNPNRLEVSHGIEKRLISGNKKNGAMPVIRHFEDYRDEIAYTIKAAKAELEAFRSPAILVRINALALPFVSALQAENIPHQHFSPSGIFSKPAVKQSLALLRVLGDPSDSLALFKFLSLPVWKIPLELLLESMRKSKLRNIPLFLNIDAAALVPAKHILQELIEFSREHSVSQVLGRFFEETGYLEKMEKSDPAVLTEIAEFSEKIRHFESTHEDSRVQDFLAYIDLVEEGGETRGGVELLDSESVKILTIHAAKGLEFDTVFIPGLVQGKFPGVNRREPFEIPEPLIKEPFPKHDHHLEEERRLFFVGLTRAKTGLCITYSDFYDGKKQWKVSPFILEILEAGKATMEKSKRKKSIQQPSLDIGSDRIHRPIALPIKKLSFSQMDAFRTCPLKYQLRYLWSIPTPMPSIVNFGSSIHNTLKDFYSFIMENPPKDVGNEGQILKRMYEKNWIPFGYESKAMEEDEKKRGLAMLEHFREKEQKEKPRPEFLERSFTLKLGDLVVTGRIDRIDRLPDGTFEVIDYKTGGSIEKNLKHDLQLTIYALACSEVFKLPVSRLSLYYLPELQKTSTSRSEKDLEACREEIIECAAEMSRSNFAANPGFHCRYCDFRTICSSAV